MLWSQTSRDLERSPHAVEYTDAVDLEIRGITCRRREYTTFDMRQAEAKLLIEPQEPGIRGCSGHENSMFAALARMRDPGSGECSAESDASRRLEDSEALELGIHHLNMPDASPL